MHWLQFYFQQQLRLSAMFNVYFSRTKFEGSPPHWYIRFQVKDMCSAVNAAKTSTLPTCARGWENRNTERETADSRTKRGEYEREPPSLSYFPPQFSFSLSQLQSFGRDQWKTACQQSSGYTVHPVLFPPNSKLLPTSNAVNGGEQKFRFYCGYQLTGLTQNSNWTHQQLHTGMNWSFSE